MSERKLRRAPARGWIAGVCAGIADFADVDRMVVRALYVLGTVITFLVPGALAYLVMWAVIPPERDAAAGAGAGDVKLPQQR